MFSAGTDEKGNFRVSETKTNFIFLEETFQIIKSGGFQGLLISPNYLSNVSEFQVRQGFVLGNNDDNKLVPIQIKYLTSINGSNVTLISYKFDKQLKSIR